MKKIFLLVFITLMTICQATAQSDLYPPLQSKTYYNFNEAYVNHRHTIYLEKGNKMIVELSNLDGYKLLGNIDTILQGYIKEMAFFKDSLQVSPSGNIRIDYSYIFNLGNKKIRITKYDPSGNSFIDKNGTVSNLKIEQDTIRLLLTKVENNGPRPPKSKKNWSANSVYTAQITFVLNNHDDINRVIANDKELQCYIDTMVMACKHKRDFDLDYIKTTISYYPYSVNPPMSSNKHKYDISSKLFLSKGRLWGEGFQQSDRILPTIGFYVDIGAGLVRDKIAPLGEMGIEFRNPKDRPVYVLDNYQFIAAVSLTPCVIFDKTADGKYGTYDNWFVNAEVGSLMKHGGNPMVTRGTIGVGYLLQPNGIYFQNTTCKTFMNFTFKSELVIQPEIYFTDNFHTVFPGITVKGFLHRRTD